MEFSSLRRGEHPVELGTLGAGPGCDIDVLRVDDVASGLRDLAETNHLVVRILSICGHTGVQCYDHAVPLSPVLSDAILTSMAICMAHLTSSGVILLYRVRISWTSSRDMMMALRFVFLASFVAVRVS